MGLFNLALAALWERRLRAGLTITMVIVGGMLNVAVNGMSAGTVDYIMQQIEFLGTDLIIAMPQGGDFKITKSVVDEIDQKVDHIKQIVTFRQQTAAYTSKGEDQVTIIIAVDQRTLPSLFPTMKLEQGGFVEDNDPVGCVLGSQLSENVDVGNAIKVQFQIPSDDGIKNVRGSFLVRGTLEYIGGGGGMFLPLDRMMFISARAGETFLERSANDYDGMYIISEDAEYNDYIQDTVEDLFPDMSVISPKSITDIINQMVTAIAGFVDGIAVVALGVAAVGIVASLYTSMMERTREIGTLKALGFSKKRITALFLYEAMIIGLVGGGLGVILGIPLSFIMNQAVRGFGPTRFQPIFYPQMFFFTFVLCVALSLLAGIYPAWRAAQLDAVVALRKE